MDYQKLDGTSMNKESNLDAIEIQCSATYKEPFDLVLKTVDDTLVSVPVTKLDLEKLQKAVHDFLQELYKSSK